MVPAAKVTKYWVLPARLAVGSIVKVELEILKRLLLAALKVSTIVPVADPERKTILPVPSKMASLKVRTTLLARATLVAPSVGLKEETVGAMVSGAKVLKSYVVVPA